MPADPHSQDLDAPGSELALSPDAERYISILRAYFGFQGYVGAFVAVFLPFAWVFHLGRVTITGNPWITLPLLAVNTWAAFRTRRLLLERDRDGAWMAGVLFACDLIAARTAGQIDFGAILSGIGVLLAINVYRNIRRAESAYRLKSQAGI